MSKQAIKLPDNLSGKFRLTAHVYGGPVFDFPAQGVYKVNLSELSENIAGILADRGWKGIERVKEKPAPAEKADKG